MNFEFSQDQEQLRDQARRLMQDHCSSDRVRKVLDSDAVMDHELWRQLVQLGWTATALPERYGGFGMGYLELCVLAEELGRALAPVPFSSSMYLATEALLKAGSDAQRQQFLPQLADGTAIGSLAYAEGPGSVATSGIETRYDGKTLSGTKLPVADGEVATLLVVVAKEEDDTLSLFLVERDAGYTCAPVTTIDASRSHSRIRFEQTPAQRLGAAGCGEQILAEIFDRAAVLFAFEQLGGAQAALDMGVRYANERFAFGRAIGSFQAIKHKLADLYCLTELARSNCYYAAWALSTAAPELPVAAATARISATKAFHECSKENIQIHGGMGFTWEFDCHLYYRRSKLLGLAIGSELEWKQGLLTRIESAPEPADPPQVPEQDRPAESTMDFNDTPEEAAFRAEARAWLDANAPAGWQQTIKKDVDDLVAAGRAWQARKAATGWACIQWPREYGGRDASPMQQAICNEEEGELAKLTWFSIVGIGMAAPTLMAYADEEHKRYLLPRLASADDIWCQLFSEPGAGSDLAAVRTRAVRDGSDWIVNGQKIWTSFAHRADWGILITRTDPDVPKHRGLSYFFVDMRSAGVEVRPIKQISGGTEFNEVYLTDVRIPDSQRLGEIGSGWRVALTTLMSERSSIGNVFVSSFDEMHKCLQNLTLADTPALENAAVRDRLAEFYVNGAGIRTTNYRALSALSKGRTPGPEASIGKLVMGRQRQNEASFLLDLQNYAGILTDQDAVQMDGFFQHGFLRNAGNRIEGGTDEILSNIIAERVLGLPGDPRVDKDVAFKDIPTS